jgi:hypothetical protein
MSRLPIHCAGRRKAHRVSGTAKKIELKQPSAKGLTRLFEVAIILMRFDYIAKLDLCLDKLRQL